MDDADLGLFGASGREVLIEESLAGGKVARCWVERRALDDMDLTAWWRWVGEAGNGWRSWRAHQEGHAVDWR